MPHGELGSSAGIDLQARAHCDSALCSCCSLGCLSPPRAAQARSRDGRRRRGEGGAACAPRFSTRSRPAAAPPAALRVSIHWHSSMPLHTPPEKSQPAHATSAPLHHCFEQLYRDEIWLRKHAREHMLLLLQSSPVSFESLLTPPLRCSCSAATAAQPGFSTIESLNACLSAVGFCFRLIPSSFSAASPLPPTHWTYEAHPSSAVAAAAAA